MTWPVTFLIIAAAAAVGASSAVRSDEVGHLPVNNTKQISEEEALRILPEKRADAPTCADVGGKCMSTKGAKKKCKGKIDKKLGCTEKTQVCCIDGCPDEPGFVHITAPVQRCYRAFSDTTRNWYETKNLCAWYGWKMAQPADVLSLRSIFIQTIGFHHSFLWLGASADGSDYIWENTDIKISNQDALWYHGGPTHTEVGYCLGMGPYFQLENPYEHVYAAWPCTWRGPNDDTYALCEVPL